MTRTNALTLAFAAAALASCNAAPKAPAQAATAPLSLEKTIEVPDYSGDFDHFAIDRKNGQLLLAGEEHHELLAFDLASGALKTRIPGFGAPHSLYAMPETNEVLVLDGEKPSPVLDATTLKPKRTYALPAGADSIGEKATGAPIWVVTGGKDVPQKDSNLVELDPATGKVLRKIHFDADHVEAMAVESAGTKIYINVTDKNRMDVIDTAAGKVEKSWAIDAALGQNACVVMDEKNRRLFVVTRKPGNLLILNADTGAVMQVIKTPERADQMIWDPDNRRIYVTGGEGYISVVQQDDADHYRETARIKSLPGAKTAILDRESHRLFVAASPGETKVPGAVLIYKVAQ